MTQIFAYQKVCIKDKQTLRPVLWQIFQPMAVLQNNDFYLCPIISARKNRFLPLSTSKVNKYSSSIPNKRPLLSCPSTKTWRTLRDTSCILRLKPPPKKNISSVSHFKSGRRVRNYTNYLVISGVSFRKGGWSRVFRTISETLVTWYGLTMSTGFGINLKKTSKSTHILWGSNLLGKRLLPK